MAFVKFMSSTAGRILRVVAGLILMWVGFIMLGGLPGIIVGIIGILPLVAGIIDICVFAPLFGGPLSGKAARALK